MVGVSICEAVVNHGIGKENRKTRQKRLVREEEVWMAEKDVEITRCKGTIGTRRLMLVFLQLSTLLSRLLVVDRLLASCSRLSVDKIC